AGVDDQVVEGPPLIVAKPPDIGMVLIRVDLIECPSRYFPDEGIGIEELRNQVELEIFNTLNADLKDHAGLGPAVRLCEIPIDNELQHQPGVKFHPWVKVIQAVYP